MNNSVVSVLVFLSLGVILVVFLYYRLSFSERTLFKGRLRLLQFLLGIVLPPIMILPVFQLYRMIERNTFVAFLPLGDDGFLFLLFSLIALASVGNGMHVAGVSIDYSAQNLDGLDEEDRAVLRVVEFFHHGFSHLLVQLPIALIVFTLFLFELNHPSNYFLNEPQLMVVIAGGAVFGLVSALSVIDGSVWKVLLPVMLSLVIFMPLVVDSGDVSVFRLPVGLYFWSSHLTATIFLVLWGFYHRGFPEIIGELKVKDGHPVSPRLSRFNSNETAA